MATRKTERRSRANARDTGEIRIDGWLSCSISRARRLHQHRPPRETICTTCIRAPSEWLDPMIWRSPSSGESNRLFSAGQPHHPRIGSVPPAIVPLTRGNPPPVDGVFPRDARRGRLARRVDPRRAPARRHAVRASASRDADRDPDDPASAPASAPAPSRRRALAAAVAAPFLPGALAAASALSAAPAAFAAASPAVTSKVFFDFAVDAQPAGRVVVGVFGDANPIAAARFAALARGVQGLGYRRTQVDAVEYNEDGGVDSPLFVGDAGVRALSSPDRPPRSRTSPGVSRRSRSRPSSRTRRCRTRASGWCPWWWSAGRRRRRRRNDW